MPLTNPSEVVVLSQSFEFTNAQVKASPTTPLVIVPATEVINYTGIPTRLQIPLFAFVRTANLAAAYDNINASVATYINLGSDNSFTYSGPLKGGAYLQFNGSVFMLPCPGFLTGSESGVPIVASFNNLNDSLLDNAICFAVNNQGTGNFTGGEPANVIKGLVLYAIIDVQLAG